MLTNREVQKGRWGGIVQRTALENLTLKASRQGIVPSSEKPPYNLSCG